MNSENLDANVRLRVVDAIKGDAGRGLIRIDPDVVKKLDLNTGDAIQIINSLSEKKTAALLYPGSDEDKGKGTIRLDPAIRRNLDALVDETVVVKKIEAALAKRVTFLNLTTSVTVTNTKQILRTLENRVVSKGDILSFFSINKRIDFMVEEYFPGTEAVRIHLGTKILINDKNHGEFVAEKIETSYEDIGGLKEEIAEVENIIEIKLFRSGSFKKFGIDSPKGILFYGPPGIGKTLLARTVAQAMNAYFITVNGPEVKSSSNSEMILRKKFNDAKKIAPSIIFFDHIDYIAPPINEKQVKEGQYLEHQLATVLLNMMDELHHDEDVIIIGATYSPELIEPALLRTGRFEKLIQFNLPNVKDRMDIYKIHTRSLPMEEDVNLEELAHKSDGFTGADIKGACTFALLNAIKRTFPQKSMEDQTKIQGDLDNVKVNHQDFSSALEEVTKRRTKLI